MEGWNYMKVHLSGSVNSGELNCWVTLEPGSTGRCGHKGRPMKWSCANWWNSCSHSYLLLSHPQTVLQYTVPCYCLCAGRCVQSSLWCTVKLDNFVFILPGLFAVTILEPMFFTKLHWICLITVLWLFYLFTDLMLFFIDCSSARHNIQTKGYAVSK